MKRLATAILVVAALATGAVLAGDPSLPQPVCPAGTVFKCERFGGIGFFTCGCR